MAFSNPASPRPSPLTPLSMGSQLVPAPLYMNFANRPSLRRRSRLGASACCRLASDCNERITWARVSTASR